MTKKPIAKKMIVLKLADRKDSFCCGCAACGSGCNGW